MLEGAEKNAENYKIHSYYVIHRSKHELIKKALLNEPLWTSLGLFGILFYPIKWNC